jgi:hypothetical protein
MVGRDRAGGAGAGAGLMATVLDDWARIAEPDVRVLFEDRQQPLSDETLATMLAEAPKTIVFAGHVDDLSAALSGLPVDLIGDACDLARRFAALMQVDTVRVRVEALVHDACTRVHADYTDLRLITTYAGPGTDYVEGDDRDAPLKRVPQGRVGLFKGQLFGAGHAPCLHRSPPIVATDERRLMLVIDTPARA